MQRSFHWDTQLVLARVVLVAQAISTVLVIGWSGGNLMKLGIMAAIWAVGFQRISRAELSVMAGVNLLFTGLNIGALNAGVFHFNHPDLWGMPIYEYFMWGFYVLNTIRFVGAVPAQGRLFLPLSMAGVFAVPFMILRDPGTLLLVSGAILLVSFLMFHELGDFAYSQYMLALGAAIEYMGVSTEQWQYPGHPFGGVPLWFITLWAGTGLFARRLVLPLLGRIEHRDLG